MFLSAGGCHHWASLGASLVAATTVPSCCRRGVGLSRPPSGFQPALFSFVLSKPFQIRFLQATTQKFGLRKSQSQLFKIFFDANNPSLSILYPVHKLCIASPP
jgi:hypothetical protein